MKNILTYLSITFSLVGCSSIKSKFVSELSDGPTVMLFSTFHFANPGLDKVKNKVKNVMDETSQSYLEKLSRRIFKFKPTVILLEFDDKKEKEINRRYTQYLRGDYQLSVGEIDQLGFRIAKLSGLRRIDGFDDRGIPWAANKLFKEIKNEPMLEKRFNEDFRKITKDENEAHSSLSLQGILKRYNSSDMDRRNKSLYILTNVIGVDKNFAGADASASWWQRNFRMLAKIQKFAKPKQRILVIGGQGHIAVIRDLIKFDSNITIENIHSYL